MKKLDTLDKVMIMLAVLIPIVFYLLFAFINTDINFINWSVYCRIVLVAITIFFESFPFAMFLAKLEKF